MRLIIQIAVLICILGFMTAGRQAKAQEVDLFYRGSRWTICSETRNMEAVVERLRRAGSTVSVQPASGAAVAVLNVVGPDGSADRIIFYRTRETCQSQIEAMLQRMWWTYTQGLRDCMRTERSPADQIESIQRNRERPEVEEIGPRGAPHTVIVQNSTTIWTYFRTEAACRAALEARRPPSHLR